MSLGWAPQVPDPKTVPVTFRSVNKRTGRSVTLTSSITIVEPRWTGLPTRPPSSAWRGVAWDWALTSAL